MKRRFQIFVCLLLVIFSSELLSAFPLATAENADQPAAPLSREELEKQIQIKAKQLETINNALESTKQNLKDVKEEKLTLQRELKTIQNNINQLDLSIKADQVTVQKLALEIDSLGYNLEDIKSSILNKRSAIEKLLVELQKNDQWGGNLLITFLRSNSLADGISEAQALKDIQNQLTTDIVNLHNLQDEYNNKLQETSNKKSGIIFHRQNLENKKLIVQDQKEEHKTILAKTKSKESVFERQVAELEKLQRQIASEVEALGAVLRTKIDPSLLPAPHPGLLAMPIATTKSDITQDYGATSFAKYGYRGKWHNGIDIKAPIGTPVLAADDGTVVAIGNQDNYCYRGAYGKYITIKHANNLVTLYAHLSRQVVEKGDTIKSGQVIGYSGKSGYATGPHLHFTVYAGPTFYIGSSRVCGPMPYGGDLNPLGYL